MPSGGVHPILTFQKRSAALGHGLFWPIRTGEYSGLPRPAAADGNVVATIRLDRRDAVAKIEIVLVDVQQDVHQHLRLRSLG